VDDRLFRGPAFVASPLHPSANQDSGGREHRSETRQEFRPAATPKVLATFATRYPKRPDRDFSKDMVLGQTSAATASVAVPSIVSFRFPPTSYGNQRTWELPFPRQRPAKG